MKRNFSIYISILCIAFLSCKKDWLQREPKSLILEDQVWNSSKQITSLLANYYDRLPTDMGLQDLNDLFFTGGPPRDGRLAQWRNMADYDDALWSGAGEGGRNNMPSYNSNRWFLWNYSFIRDINKTIDGINQFSTQLTATEKNQFLAELRFLRALNYFELVKRMGGVPLITEQLVYNYDGDASDLRKPRAKEEEVYDFIAKELDEIKDNLGNLTVGGTKITASNSRANKYTALALKSRAMLYAASLAKYNNLMPTPIRLASGAIGMSAARANEYYQKSLDASKEIINSGAYSLVMSAGNPQEAFYEAVTKKSGNTEVIFAKDFLTSKDKRHLFAYDNIVRGIREDNLSSSNITPVLNLVESYEYLDGSPGVLKTTASGDYIYYDKAEDIFANKDGRLGGTVILPGSTFKGATIEMQTGLKVWNGTGYTTVEGAQIPSFWVAPAYPNGDGRLLTAASGPHRSIQEVSNTGFYLRKYIDDVNLSSTRGIRSDVWWVWFRLGEIYLNAAEAAMELGQTTDALMYANKLRERAGFPPNSLTTINLDKIENERRVELAFEDHRIWDLKRWRRAHLEWNGDANSSSANLFALYPYRVVRPGHPTDGKWVYDKLKAPKFGAPRFFNAANNYYAFISQEVRNNNSSINADPNPGQ